MSPKPSDEPNASSVSTLSRPQVRARKIVDAEPSDCTARPGGTRTIKVLRKNNREEVHVRVMDLDGTSLIDLRVFEPDSRHDYEPMPTRSGICLPRFQLRALIEALETAEGSVR